MWQYRLTMPPLCKISTNQPQPRTLMPPSRSHVPIEELHSETMTLPAETAKIGVFRPATRSVPLWVGGPGSRKPEPTRAAAGWTNAPAGTFTPLFAFELLAVVPALFEARFRGLAFTVGGA